MELVILLLLIILNGILAMSEMAIVSARKTRIQDQLDDGNQNAKIILDVLEDPSRFLSTVQVGITLVGIGAGAFGGSTIAMQLADWIRTTVPAISEYANSIGFALVVGLTTYLSLVIGELVPKQIALRDPEGIALAVARPMHLLSLISTPIVLILSYSTNLITKLMGSEATESDLSNDNDIIALMRAGLETGEFAVHEHLMVKGALELDDRRIVEIMTPRTNIISLNINASHGEIKNTIIEDQHSAYPVYQDDIENIVGYIQTKDALVALFQDNTLDIRKMIRPVGFLPETALVSRVLQMIREEHLRIIMIVGEHGNIEGLVTLHDIIEELIGDLERTTPQAQKRADGSMLVDGAMALSDFEEVFPDFEQPEDELGAYQTIAGFALARFGTIPQATDTFTWGIYLFEVVDMDNNRIDKLLITQQLESET